MMRNATPQNGEMKRSPLEALNIVVLVIRAWATSLEMFLHRDFGRRYLGLQASAVIFLIPFYCTTCAGYDIRPMFGFLVAYLTMCILHRLSGLSRDSATQGIHSMYTGYPRIWKLVPWISEIGVKKFVEPPAAFAVGLALCAYSPPLGIYVILGAFALMGSAIASDEAQRVRAIEMNDAVIEQQLVAERFRDLRGDRF
jgi:hypothetical protein